MCIYIIELHSGWWSRQSVECLFPVFGMTISAHPCMDSRFQPIIAGHRRVARFTRVHQRFRSGASLCWNLHGHVLSSGSSIKFWCMLMSTSSMIQSMLPVWPSPMRCPLLYFLAMSTVLQPSLLHQLLHSVSTSKCMSLSARPPSASSHPCQQSYL